MLQSIDQPMLPILFVASCVHRRAYSCTCARRVQTTTYPGHTTQTDLGTSLCTHTRNYKDTPVHGQTQAPVYTTCVAQAVHAKYCTGTSTACKPKHAGIRTIGASPRAIHAKSFVQAQCVRTTTSTHVHYVRRPGCPCHKLYVYKYSVRVQARGLTHNRCIAQAVHAKHCTSTVRKYKHKHSCTLRTPPRLSMSVHAQRARPSTRAYAKSVHRPGCPCQNTVQGVEAQCVRTSTSTHAYYVRRPGCPCHVRYMHAYTYSRRVVQRSSCTCRPLHIHTYTYKIHCLGCSSQTPYRTYTRGKCSAQAPA